MQHEGMCMENTMSGMCYRFSQGSTISKITYPFKIIYSVERKANTVDFVLFSDAVHLNNLNYQLTPSIILEIVQWRKKEGKECKIIYIKYMITSLFVQIICCII